jgi:hypothetical protein
MPAGMDWAVVGLWVCRFRKTSLPCLPPIRVRVEEAGYWSITDGRHRVVAALVAGRTHIDAVLDNRDEAGQ